MPIIRRLALLVLAAGLLSGCGRPVTEETKILRFTAIPDQTSTELQEKFHPLVEYLGQQLEISVEYVPARDYQRAVEMFKNADVMLAWFGGLTGVQARQGVPGARAIAQGAADPTNYSYFIAHKDTGLELSQEFPASIAELVESGQYQVGVINYKVYDRRVEAGQTDPEVCRIIWKTPLFADYNWTAHPELEAQFGTGFTARLQQALINIEDPLLLVALPRTRLIAASNEDFEGIREAAKELNMVR